MIEISVPLGYNRWEISLWKCRSGMGSGNSRKSRERRGQNMQPYEWKAQYYETDQMGIVHHSNYIRWFESARIDYMDQMGIPYKKMEEDGIICPVLSASCEYHVMTFFGDTVSISVSIKSYNGIRLILSYEVRDKETGELKANGETGHCFLNRSRKLVSLKKAAPETDAVFRKYAAEKEEGQKA